jgi:ubiquinone/menaquinone biosynthesis C-methylase UbiE
MDKQHTHLEAEHYDRSALEIKDAMAFYQNSLKYSESGLLRAAHKKWEEIIDIKTKELSTGNILDYGCGKGNFSVKYASGNWKVTGIDISPRSIEIANKIKTELKKDAEYLVMDCEKTEFGDNQFDLILDYGTFSSLNMNAALTELIRILKANGSIIAIETFGHNPFTNFKRWINILTRKRTKWAASHIMKANDWKKISSCFEVAQIYYFGFWVIFISPFSRLLPKKLFLALLSFHEKLDRITFKISCFRKLAFKTVVVLENPKK